MKRLAAGLAALLVIVLVPSAAFGVEVPYPVLTLNGPASVAPGTQIMVSGTLVRSDGEPYQNAHLAPTYRCALPEPGPYIGVGDVETDASGAFSFAVTAGACDRYEFVAGFHDPVASWWAWDGLEVGVERTVPTLDVVTPADALTVEDVPVDITLLDSEGEPVAGAAVVVDRVVWDQNEKSWTVTTDDYGKARIVDSLTTVNHYEYSARYAGSADYAPATGESEPMWVSRRPTSITFDGPDTGVIDQPIPVTGKVTGPPLPAEVTITAAGFSKTVSTDSDGNFATAVTTELGAPGVGFIASYAGDLMYENSLAIIEVSVPKLATSFGPVTSEPVPAGQPAVIVGTIDVDKPVEVAIVSNSVPAWNYTATTDGDGDFTVQVPPTLSWTFVGAEEWTVSFGGTDRYLPALSTTAITTWTAHPLSLTVDPHRQVTVNRGFTLRGRLSGPPVGSRVHVRAPWGDWSGVTSGTGVFAVGVKAGSARGVGHYQVSFTPPAGSVYPASAKTITVEQWATRRLRLLPRKPLTVDRLRRYVYRASDNPLLVATEIPAARGSCHRYNVDRLVGRTWKKVLSTGCRAVDVTTGQTRWRWTGLHVRGAEYRVSVEMPNVNRYWRGSSGYKLFVFR